MKYIKENNLVGSSHNFLSPRILREKVFDFCIMMEQLFIPIHLYNGKVFHH